jgi:hypothetical protein
MENYATKNGENVYFQYPWKPLIWNRVNDAKNVCLRYKTEVLAA